MVRATGEPSLSCIIVSVSWNLLTMSAMLDSRISKERTYAQASHGCRRTWEMASFVSEDERQK